ncbi:hypothetical protein [Chryseobacterium indoltheticum]|uniref:hypothetical protein n=1 Tax=Chryseobacterium indoltheticum TaxID=254 RepID=UPI003F499404
MGLGAFLSVNQGSAHDAAFTILEYKTTEKKAKTFGLVGKCVLFDTGGISLKASDNMHYMKSDMRRRNCSYWSTYLRVNDETSR